MNGIKKTVYYTEEELNMNVGVVGFLGLFLGIILGFICSMWILEASCVCVKLIQHEMHEPMILENSAPKSMSTIKTAQIELDCLAEAIYFEAGNQSYDGKLAVGQVILNRTNASITHSICKTIHTKSQFSYIQNKPKYNFGYRAWLQSTKVAIKLLESKDNISPIGENVMYYHASYITPPSWTKKMEKIIEIDDHIFYKEIES